MPVSPLGMDVVGSSALDPGSYRKNKEMTFLFHPVSYRGGLSGQRSHWTLHRADPEWSVPTSSGF